MPAEKKVAFITGVARVHRLAERLKARGVYVNGARQNLPHAPLAGWASAVTARKGGRAGIDEFLRYQAVR